MHLRRYPRKGSGEGAGSLLAKQRSSGSGVIVDPNGYIVTNAHVVQSSEMISVLLATNKEQNLTKQSILKMRGELLDATIVGVDFETDLAVLKIEKKELPYLEFSDSDKLRQGQIVMAFGSPLGLENSMTMGIVSSMARQLEPEGPMVYIQTDAPINPGNSGGPLLDTNGKIVGINTLIFSQSGGNEGIGFAAPSNIVRNVYSQIKQCGRVRRGEIGVFAQTITPTLSGGLALSRSWGVILADVYPNSPAFRAGLQVGDIVLTLNDKLMENGRQFNINLYRYAGDKVKIEAIRGNETKVFQIVVEERKDDPFRFAEMADPKKNLIPQFGILAINIDNRIEKILPPQRKENGVLVAARSRDAVFMEGGFLPGDIIYSVNNQMVLGLSSLRAIVNSLKTGDNVVVQIERARQLRYVPLILQ
jgi:serine protease Do